MLIPPLFAYARIKVAPHGNSLPMFFFTNRGESVILILSYELMNDFMALIASFSGRFYRLRTKNNQKKLLNDAEKLVEQGNEE